MRGRSIMCEIAENVKRDMGGGALKKEKTDKTRPIRFERNRSSLPFHPTPEKGDRRCLFISRHGEKTISPS
jgi:hypothetical protein